MPRVNYTVAGVVNDRLISSDLCCGDEAHGASQVEQAYLIPDV